MKFNCKTPSELLKAIKNQDIKMVDLRFIDTSSKKIAGSNAIMDILSCS